MSKKIAVVTGTSSGLGYETSLLLAEQGYKVYATMRNLKKSTALKDIIAEKGLSIEVYQLDVTDTKSITTCIDRIIEDEGQIDVLVNNAGAGFIRTTEHASEEEIQWQLDVNLFGVIRCTKAVLPSMRLRKSGHIINISSVGGLVGQPFNEIYCAAKFAVEGYTEAMASYIQPAFNINFTAIEPGGIQSEFANNALSQFQQSGGMIEDDYKPLLESYIASAQSRSADGIYQTSKEVAEVVVSCLSMDQPPVRMRTSDWGENFTKYKTSVDPSGLLIQAQTSKLMGQ